MMLVQNRFALRIAAGVLLTGICLGQNRPNDDRNAKGPDARLRDRGAFNRSNNAGGSYSQGHFYERKTTRSGRIDDGHNGPDSYTHNRVETSRNNSGDMSGYKSTGLSNVALDRRRRGGAYIDDNPFPIGSVGSRDVTPGGATTAYSFGVSDRGPSEVNRSYPNDYARPAEYNAESGRPAVEGNGSNYTTASIETDGYSDRNMYYGENSYYNSPRNNYGGYNAVNNATQSNPPVQNLGYGRFAGRMRVYNGNPDSTPRYGGDTMRGNTNFDYLQYETETNWRNQTFNNRNEGRPDAHWSFWRSADPDQLQYSPSLSTDRLGNSYNRSSPNQNGASTNGERAAGTAYGYGNQSSVQNESAGSGE